MTIPAMAPPESPDPDGPEPVAAPPVPEGIFDEVPVGNTGGIETVVGSLSPSQRRSTLALTQQESVEFAVLLAQYMQSPCRLFW
jgi:hypothetical protein